MQANHVIACRHNVSQMTKDTHNGQKTSKSKSLKVIQRATCDHDFNSKQNFSNHKNAKFMPKQVIEIPCAKGGKILNFDGNLKFHEPKCNGNDKK